MKIIIPMAGKHVDFKSDSASTVSLGSDFKPLLNIAGKPLIGYVLDGIIGLRPEEVIFIVNKEDVVLKNFVSKHYGFKTRFVLQKDRKGVAHAVYGAKKFVEGSDFVVLFSDSIVDANFDVLKNLKADAIIWTKKVKDPRNFGVVFTYEGFASQLIEKPELPVSDKAMVGLYYFSKGCNLFEMIEHIMKNNIKTHGEFQLTDALQFMIQKDSKILALDVKHWFDCGSRKNLLATNEYLLSKKGANFHKGNNCVIIRPVFIDKSAHISNSIIGPFVSIGKNAVVDSSVVTNSIIGDSAVLKNSVLKESILGTSAVVASDFKQINVKDLAEIYYP